VQIHPPPLSLRRRVTFLALRHKSISFGRVQYNIDRRPACRNQCYAASFLRVVGGNPDADQID
jgi:hypothetical protein